jgi:hypothetical protein
VGEGTGVEEVDDTVDVTVDDEELLVVVEEVEDTVEDDELLLVVLEAVVLDRVDDVVLDVDDNGACRHCE